MDPLVLETSGIFPEMVNGSPTRATHRVKDAPAGARIPNVGVVPLLCTGSIQLVFEDSIERGSEAFRSALCFLAYLVVSEVLESEDHMMYPPTYQLFLNAIKQKLYDLADRGVLVRKYDGGWALSS